MVYQQKCSDVISLYAIYVMSMSIAALNTKKWRIKAVNNFFYAALLGNTAASEGEPHWIQQIYATRRLLLSWERLSGSLWLCFQFHSQLTSENTQNSVEVSWMRVAKRITIYQYVIEFVDHLDDLRELTVNC